MATDSRVELVKLTHPKLPGRAIHVAACAVWHHERSGWQAATAETSAPVDLTKHETENGA